VYFNSTLVWLILCALFAASQAFSVFQFHIGMINPGTTPTKKTASVDFNSTLVWLIQDDFNNRMSNKMQFQFHIGMINP